MTGEFLDALRDERERVAGQLAEASEVLVRAQEAVDALVDYERRLDIAAEVMSGAEAASELPPLVVQRALPAPAAAPDPAPSEDDVEVAVAPPTPAPARCEWRDGLGRRCRMFVDHENAHLTSDAPVPAREPLRRDEMSAPQSRRAPVPERSRVQPRKSTARAIGQQPSSREEPIDLTALDLEVVEFLREHPRSPTGAIWRAANGGDEYGGRVRVVEIEKSLKRLRDVCKVTREGVRAGTRYLLCETKDSEVAASAGGQTRGALTAPQIAGPVLAAIREDPFDLNDERLALALDFDLERVALATGLLIEDGSIEMDRHGTYRAITEARA